MFAGYRIEGVLARGGMGVVYTATDPDLERTVALKIIAPEHTQNPDAVARFKSEARLAASLEHPNIVPIHRGGEFGGVLYLAMRLVPGTNLREIIDQGPLPTGRVRRVIAQVAAALDAAHARGLVHRDVKPGNILISGAGEHEHVYLTDFGLTKQLGTAGSLTRTGMWVGTPDYVAPEQIQGQKIDGRTDIYALGCVLYEMLTGSVAFPRDNDAAKLWAHMTEPPPPLTSKRPDLVPAFGEVVARATAKDPDARYAKASELAAGVDRAIAEQQSKPKTEVSPASRPFDATVRTTDVLEDASVAEATHQARRSLPPTARMPEQRAGPPPAQDPPGGEPTGRVEERDRGGAGRLARRVWPLAAGLAVVAVVAAVVVLASGSSDDGSSNKPSGELVSGPLAAVPTNHVDGAGTASLRVKGNVATVTLHADGLLNNAPHAMHIHAGGQGKCPPASAAKLHDGHRAMSTSNGAPFYGKPRTALTTTGPTGPASILAFQRFPATGKITYRRSIRLIPSAERFVRKNNAVIVVHGIDYNSNGIYDGVIDRSDLDRAVQGETTAPALCGRIVAAASSSASAGPQRPGGARVYTASLTLQAAAPGAPSWLCTLQRATS